MHLGVLLNTTVISWNCSLADSRLLSFKDSERFLNLYCGVEQSSAPAVCSSHGSFIPPDSIVVNINFTGQLLNAGKML